MLGTVPGYGFKRLGKKCCGALRKGGLQPSPSEALNGVFPQPLGSCEGEGVKARELFWGTPRVGAPKEGKKAADAGRGQIYDTVIVIITAL